MLKKCITFYEINKFLVSRILKRHLTTTSDSIVKTKRLKIMFCWLYFKLKNLEN